MLRRGMHGRGRAPNESRLVGEAQYRKALDRKQTTGPRAANQTTIAIYRGPDMRVALSEDVATIFHGDSKDLPLPENCVDAIVCDPPAGIGFMGKGWDGDKGGRLQWIAWLAETMAASYKALKPGGHALVWAIPRTSHWTMTAMEELGFEIRDVVTHLFGSGFPKSANVSKFIDSSLGAPGSPEAAQWEGFGTALKPAAEFWILCRKPLGEKTLAKNVLKYGAGALNIDACRVGTDDTRSPSGSRPDTGWGMGEGVMAGSACGRWPANVTLDESAAAMLDEQGPKSKPKKGRKGARGGNGFPGYDDTKSAGADGTWPADPGGGASRFFYVAKPAKSEKDAGLEHLGIVTATDMTGRKEGSAGIKHAGAGARRGTRRNSHPTVKSVALMTWLIKLIAPPGGIVLDPFAGSGTTGVAAILSGFRFIGCEFSEEYLPITEGRIRHALSTRSKP